MWTGPGGCGAVLRIAWPLILSHGAYTLQLFLDSVLLARHSSAEMAAAVQGGLVHFTILSLFFGVASYVNTFVAQYVGAGRGQRVGPAVWQGIHFSLVSGGVLLVFIPAAEGIFAWVGHAPAQRAYETTYFRILTAGSAAPLISLAATSFFTGQGKTWVVCLINSGATLVNVLGDYALIFGRWGFPELGVAGAAGATVASSVFAAAAFLALFLRRGCRRQFATLSGWKPDGPLLGRLLRFGVPNGVQFLLDMLAFSLFIVLVGRIDAVACEATSLAVRINALAFMPMIGVGIAVSTLVGQALGRNRPDLARRATWSAFYLTFAYMTLVALGYWLLPYWFLLPFVNRGNLSDTAALGPVLANLLGFVAFYCLFDGGNIIFAATLKGAGDTRFVMILSMVFGWALMVVPTFLAVRWRWGPGHGLYAAWVFCTFWVCALAVAFLLRFLQGKWQFMRVIEAAPAGLSPLAPEPSTASVKNS